MMKSMLLLPAILALAACAASPTPSSYPSVVDFAVASMESNAGILGKHLAPAVRSESDILKRAEFEAGRDQLRILKAINDYCLAAGGRIAREHSSLKEFSEYLAPDYSGGYRELLFPGISNVKVGGGGLSCTETSEISYIAMYFTRPYFSRNDGVYDLTDYLVLEKKKGISDSQFSEHALLAIKSFSLRVSERFNNSDR